MRIFSSKRKESKKEEKAIIVDAKWLDILESAEPLGTSLGGGPVSDTVISIIELISSAAGAVPWYIYRNIGDEMEEVSEEQSIIAKLIRHPCLLYTSPSPRD